MNEEERARRLRIDRELWSDGRERDPRASVPLRGHPDLPLDSLQNLLARYRDTVDAPTRVGKALGAGHGLFAAADLVAGVRIGEYVGELVEPREPDPNVAPWWLLWDDDWHVVIVTLRAVASGEELLFDYGPGFLERRGLEPD